jgi:hypothetical protein
VLRYFVGSNPGELYSFTKDFVLINLCPGHKSYWRINPAEAEAIKTDLKKRICRDRIISFSKASRPPLGTLKVFCLLYTGGSLSRSKVARVCIWLLTPHHCLHNIYSEISQLCLYRFTQPHLFNASDEGEN